MEEITNEQETIPAKENYTIENGMLIAYRHGNKKIVLSETLADKLIERVHKSYGHIGIGHMYELISKHYAIHNLSQRLAKYVKSCVFCITNKSRSKQKYGYLSKLGPATRPFEIMFLDTVGGFYGSRSNKKYLHILSDHFTRYVWINTSSIQHFQNFINLLEPIMKENQVDTVLADQYTGINSKELKHFIKNNKNRLIFTAVDSAHSNGLNERVNQTFVNRLRYKFNEEGETKAWTTLAKKVVTEYNKTKHSVTRFSPNFLLYGKSDKISPLKNEENISLEEARRRALVNINISFNRNKTHYDKRRKDIEFEEGDLVYIQNSSKLNRKKLAQIYIGPFKIEKISHSIYIIDSKKKRSENNMYHISKLIVFQPRRGM